MALRIPNFADLKPVQIPDPLVRQSKILSLQGQQLSNQDIGAQIQERQTIAQQRQTALAQKQAVDKVISDHLQGGGQVDDSLVQKLYPVSPGDAQALQKSLLEMQKATSETATAGLNQQKAQRELNTPLLENVPAGTTVLNRETQQPVFTSEKPKDYELKTGVVNGKPVTANYEKASGRVTDPQGNDITAQFQPKEASPTPDDLQRYLDAQSEAVGRPLNAFERLKAIEKYKTLAGVTSFNLQQGPADPRLANVPPNQHKDVLDKVQKANDDFTTAQQAADDMKTFVDAMRAGNKQASAYIDTEGVLTLNTGRGVKRVNQAEISSYQGAGSLYDRIVGALRKGGTGIGKSDSVINDIEQLHQMITANAGTAYKRKIESINKTYRANIQPMDTGPTTEAPVATARPRASDGKGNFVEWDGKAWVPAK